MREIQLTRGQVALTDDEDYYQLIKFNWLAELHKGAFYARRKVLVCESIKTQKIAMHRQIIGIYDPSIKIDHIDGNGLNNQRHNLRFANQSQNSMNRNKISSKCSSDYKGVVLKKTTGRWCSTISINKNKIHLGYFKREEDAALAYNQAALRYFGEFAKLNNIIPCAKWARTKLTGK